MEAECSAAREDMAVYQRQCEDLERELGNCQSQLHEKEEHIQLIENQFVSFLFLFH